MHLSELKQKTTQDLAELAEDQHIEGAHELRRQELIFALLKAEAARGGNVVAEGVLETLPDGFGFLRAPDANYLPGADDIYVSPSQIRRFNLRTGDAVTGVVRAPKESERYFALLRVQAVNEGPPDERPKIAFDQLTPVPPSRLIALGAGGDPTARAIDLVCPLARGQRALILGASASGKSRALVAIARALEASGDDAARMMLLVDQRPEEIAAARDGLATEVVASSFDEPVSRHVQLAEIVVEKAKRAVEAGRDVVLLIDSLTRIALAYAHSGDPAPVHRVRRLFGAGRAIEGGGSLTLIGTLTCDPGSRADAALHEELRDAATSMLALDRRAAAAGVFPAIDLTKTATHGVDELLDDAALKRARALRHELAGLDPVAAARGLVDKL